MTEETYTTTNSNKSYIKWIIFILIVLGLTLPFHYVPSALRMFPKDHFTFKHTIITKEDVDDIIRRYNDAKTIFQQNAMNNDPFIMTLREQGILVDIDRKDLNDESNK